MCGIAGWIDFNEDISEKEIVINKMSDTLKRRGPDAHGVFLENNACLIHRRLIVVDPANGKQPMQINNYILVYNGELYNTKEIRDRLKKLGHEFNGHSDTEVLLKAFLEWGEECVSKLNGIFAFAVWDKKNQSLFMARDRIGVKPLFFYQYKDGLIFGSEIKTLLANPKIKPEVDREGLLEILFMGPGRTNGQGILKGIMEVNPGEYVKFDRDGVIVKKYWEIKASEFSDTVAQAKEKTRFLVMDAIERQLVSDVPLCCFLSGGLDSSIISKVAAEYYRKNERGPISTYSVDYVDNEKFFQSNVFQPNSDNEYIKIMVEDIKSNHRDVVINNKYLAEALYEACEARDLPGMADIDSSLLLFCREIKKDFTVGLSGECADEIFGGYPWYHNKDILFEDCFPWSRTLDFRKQLFRDVFAQHADEYVYDKYKQTLNKTDKLPGDSKLDARMREMFMLNINWFMQTLLDRKDRMSMYHGLEVRVPFCDYRIVEYAYNMPWHIKSLYGREKGILRESMVGILPEEIISRKKSPYPKTQNPVYMNIVSNKIKSILADKSSLLSQILNYKTVIEIIENPDSLNQPWYGQLMRSPQILAYIIQIDHWFKTYNVNIV